MEETRTMVTYNLPLSPEHPTKAVIIVPEDLTKGEAERIARFLTVLGDRDLPNT